LACCSNASTAASCTLSLHDALPIYFDENRPHLIEPARPREGPSDKSTRTPPLPSPLRPSGAPLATMDLGGRRRAEAAGDRRASLDRKSTRLNSSHVKISYAVFCLKK